MRELAGRAAERGFRILQGGCVAIGGMGLPFAPIATALRDDLDPDDREALLDLDPRSFDALAALVPGLAGIAGPDRDDAPRRAATDARPFGAAASGTGLFDAFVRLFRRLAADRPLLLVIEDIHWADPATRDAITWLVPGLADERVVLCLTYRTDELDRRHPLLPWLAEIGRTGRFERVDLARFDRDDTARIVEAIHGEPMDWARLNRLHERTDGNAFFLEELLLAEAADPAAAGLHRRSRRPSSPGSPRPRTTCSGVLRSPRSPAGGSIASSSPKCRASEQDLTDGLRMAIDRQLLIRTVSGEAAGYAFRHALVREAAYDDVLPGERARSTAPTPRRWTSDRPRAGRAARGTGSASARRWKAARDDDRAAVRLSAPATPRSRPWRSRRRNPIRDGPRAVDGAPTRRPRRAQPSRAARAGGRRGRDRGEFHRMVELLREAIAIQDVVADRSMAP